MLQRGAHKIECLGFERRNCANSCNGFTADRDYLEVRLGIPGLLRDDVRKCPVATAFPQGQTVRLRNIHTEACSKRAAELEEAGKNLGLRRRFGKLPVRFSENPPLI